MQHAKHKKIKHLNLVIAWSFFLSVLAFLATFFFPSPDFSKDIPVYSEGAANCFAVSMALFIFGCTVMAIKLAEEQQTLAASGFTMMAIAMGFVYVLQFVTTTTTESLNDVYKINDGGTYLLTPAMFLIACYTVFPRWLNVLGVMATLPQVIVCIIFLSSGYNHVLDILEFISMILFNVTALCWGIFVLKGMRKELKELKEMNVPEL